MDFCASLMTACNVVYLCSSMLLLQTCPTMVKQLQRSLDAAPAIHYCSLTQILMQSFLRSRKLLQLHTLGLNFTMTLQAESLAVIECHCAWPLPEEFHMNAVLLIALHIIGVGFPIQFAYRPKATPFAGEACETNCSLVRTESCWKELQGRLAE